MPATIGLSSGPVILTWPSPSVGHAVALRLAEDPAANLDLQLLAVALCWPGEPPWIETGRAAAAVRAQVAQLASFAARMAPDEAAETHREIAGLRLSIERPSSGSDAAVVACLVRSVGVPPVALYAAGATLLGEARADLFAGFGEYEAAKARGFSPAANGAAFAGASAPPDGAPETPSAG